MKSLEMKGQEKDISNHNTMRCVIQRYRLVLWEYMFGSDYLSLWKLVGASQRKQPWKEYWKKSSSWQGLRNVKKRTMQRSKDIRENMKYSRTVGDLVQLEHLGCRGQTAGRNWWTEKLEGELEAAFPPFKEVGYHSPGNKRKKVISCFVQWVLRSNLCFRKITWKKNRNKTET